MRKIDIATLPNQSFSVQLGTARYDLTIKETRGVMSIDLSRDNVSILSGHRLAAGQPVIPYRYQEDGNFALITESDDLPDFNKFGISQNLYYFSVAELLTLRA